MRTFAYTFKNHARVMEKVAGVPPHTCPPWKNGTHINLKFSYCDLLFFTFHGLVNQPYLYSDTWETALSVDEVRHANLSRAVVFSGCCYTIESGFCQAFFDAGADAVIAGPGRNFFIPGRKAAGFDRLAYYFRLLYGLHLDAKAALDLAKTRFKVNRPNKITRDVLEFDVYRAG